MQNILTYPYLKEAGETKQEGKEEKREGVAGVVGVVEMGEEVNEL